MIAQVLQRAAGLIVSADRPLPGFVPGASPDSPYVRIHLQRRPAWESAPCDPACTVETLDASGEPIVTVSRSREGLHFHYADGTSAWVAEHGTDVWCTWPARASLADTCTYLAGPILGLVLRLRGALSLHASAVQAGAGAVAFVGPHGAGKSTLAAALAAAGRPIVTDDVLHVRPDGGRWLAEPFPSMLKLWPDGARLALGAGFDELPRIVEGWDKRALLAGDWIVAAATPLPLTALACLGPREREPRVDLISPAAALIRLTPHTSASHLLDAAARAAEFRALSGLVRSVPCFTLTPPADASGFALFVTRVLDWADAQGGADPR